MRAASFLVVLLAACGQACVPSPQPAPVPPDATDAAPVILDGAASPCEAACQNLTALCGPQATDCAEVMAKVDGRRLIRTPSGAALTCASVAGAVGKAGVAALGVSCP